MDSPAKNTRSQHRKGTLGAQPRKLGDLTDIHTGRKLGGGGLADTGATNKQAQAPTSALDMAKSGVPTKRKATSADDGSRARAAPRTTSKEGAAAPTSTRPISKAEERRKAATERRLKMEAEKKAGRLAKQEARMARTGSGEGPAASSRGVSRTGSGESRLNRHPAPRTARSTTASDAAEAAGRPKRAPRQPQADSRSKGRRGAPAVDYKDRLDKMEATLSKMVQGQGGEQPCDQDAPAAAGEAEAHLAALMEGQEAAKSRAEELTAQLAATTEAQAQALAAAAEAHGAEVEALRATHATEMKTLAEAKDATIAALEEAATVAAAAHGSELQQAQEAHSTAAAEVSRLTTLSEDRARDIEALKSSLASQAASLSSVEAKLRATELALEQERGAHASTSQARATAEAQVAEQSEQIAGLEAKSRVDEALRKKLHNTVQELKGNIRVYCRVRPLLGAEAAAEQAAEGPQLFSLPSKHEIVITDPVQRKTVDGSGTTARKSEFDFDHVFGGDASQAEVFEELSQLVQSAVDGYKVCIFCYGQTGSGKTHTMQGPDGCEDTPGAPECGLIPRSVEQIFDTAAALGSKGWTFTVTASFLEIYNEKIYDLLGGGARASQALDIKLEAHTKRTHVPGLEEVGVESGVQIYQLLKRAADSRSTSATQMNERSSRSHSVFQLKICGRNAETSEEANGVLNLIDLAGSEQLKKSGAEGDRKTETISINRSLTNLGMCIGKLANRERHVPFRDSKLTHYLQPYLGGEAKTLMFVNVASAKPSYQETLKSLKFAKKVNECEIGTAKNGGKKIDLLS